MEDEQCKAVREAPLLEDRNYTIAALVPMRDIRRWE